MALHALPTAVDFYKKHDFVKTNHIEGRMIHCEIRSHLAKNRLEKMGLI